MRQLDDEGKDAGVVEAHAFIAALSSHGLSGDETAAQRRELLGLQEAVVLVRSFQLYQRAEGLVGLATDMASTDPNVALDFLEKAAAIYKRLAVAQQYPERLLERHQQVWRMIEDTRVEHGIADERSDQVLLVGTFHSPTDLQRLLLSVTHELQGFAYGRPVHVVVSDDSTGEARARNEEIYAEAARSGLRISEWGLERRNAFLARLNDEVFADQPFDVNDLAGVAKPGEKGIPYGRLRNFLRLAGLVELREYGLDDPVFTWLDQDNELGALVLTRPGTLSKRHAYNYFDQKSGIFDDPRVLVGGGGYTNDALEGVEKFWVAWGIMHTTLGLAGSTRPRRRPCCRRRPTSPGSGRGTSPTRSSACPREGEDVETMSDQFLLLVNTLVGTFRGKYDNQVQIYHPWTYGDVDPGDEQLSRGDAGLRRHAGRQHQLRHQGAGQPHPVPHRLRTGRGHLPPVAAGGGPRPGLVLPHPHAGPAHPQREGGPGQPHGRDHQLVQRPHLPRAPVPVGGHVVVVHGRAHGRRGARDGRADRRPAGRGQGQHERGERAGRGAGPLPRRRPEGRVLVGGAGGERPPLRRAPRHPARRGRRVQGRRASTTGWPTTSCSPSTTSRS